MDFLGECRGSLLWTEADKLFNILNLKSVKQKMAFRNLADMSSPYVYDFSHEQKQQKVFRREARGGG